MKLSMVLSTHAAQFEAVAFKGDFEANVAKIAGFGYDGVELAIRDPKLVDLDELQDVIGNHNLVMPAIGTGQAWGEEGLSFTNNDPEVRRARRTEARRGTLNVDNDPFAQISQYSMVGADKQEDRSFASYDTSRFALAGQDSAPTEPGTDHVEQERPKVVTVRHRGPRVGPNDPCPCGSGKKFKKCCGGAGRN